MPLAGIADVFDRFPKDLEGAVEHLGLRDSRAQVPVGVHDEQRRLDLVGVGDRRLRPQGLEVVPRVGVELVTHETPGVTFAEERGQVVHAPLCDGRLEPVVVT